MSFLGAYTCTNALRALSSVGEEECFLLNNDVKCL